MKSAYKKNQELVSEIENADESSEKFHLWWLGQSGFLIKWQQDYLLLDPYLSAIIPKIVAKIPTLGI